MVAHDFEIVRQRDGAEIAAERRADLGRRGEHGRHAGLDANVERPPRRIAGLDRFEHRRRHGEHAGIAARHDGDLAARRPRAQARGARGRARRDCPRHAGTDPARVRHAIEIGSVADEVGRLRQARAARPASSAPACPGPVPTMTSEPLTAAAPARDQHHGEIGARRLAALGAAAGCARPAWCRARHRSRATSRPARLDGAAHLGEVACRPS